MRATILTLLTLIAFANHSLAADKPIVKACYEDEDSYPWVLKDRPGRNILMLQMVEERLGSKIEMTPLPWRRCMLSVKEGIVDAAFKISYSAARAAELGNYPMAGDKPDVSRRMLTLSYSLYRLKGTAVDWDGKTLKIKGSVGAQSGFSAVEQMRSWGIKVDDGSSSADTNLKKLLLGRFDAVALQTEEGDFRVKSNPQFKARIERMSPALVEKPYYLIFSKQFAVAHPEHVNAVWDTIGQVRESAEYLSVVKTFK